MLKIEFWTSDFDVKKWSKRPRDPHNRIRLEKLCPKVVSDRKMVGRMPSRRRFWDFLPMIFTMKKSMFTKKKAGHSGISSERELWRVAGDPLVKD